MTDSLRSLDRKGPPRPEDFDLVEDLGGADPSDQEAFDRALSALLPQEARPAADGAAPVDIDLDDFEAFNRELDARLAEARGRVPDDDTVEDLGAEIVAGPVPAPTPAVPPRPAASADAPAASGPVDLADDVVTLGAAGVAAAGAATTAAVPRTETPPPPAPGDPAAAMPPPRRGGSALALALGAAGLVAGIAALWASHSRQADLERLEAALAKTAAAPTRPATPTSPTLPGPSTDALRLDARLGEIAHRLDALGAAVSDGGEASRRVLQGVEERLARAEAQLAAAKAAEPPAAGSQDAHRPPVEAPPAPVKPKEPAKVPPKVAGEAPRVQAAEPPPTPPLAPAASPDVPAAAAAAAPATAAKPKKALPKASGGSWAIVVGSFPSEAEAYRRLNRVEGAGLVADVVPAQLNGQTWHRLVVPGYASQDEAKSVAADLRSRGLGQPWVYQRKAD